MSDHQAQLRIGQLESALAKSQESHEELGIQHGNLTEKFSRLLYITGQLVMLRDKDSKEYNDLHTEYITMKFPAFQAKAEDKES